MTFNPLPSFFGALLTQLPVFLVWLGGMILALMNWKKYPRVAALVLTALLILFFNALAALFLSVWLPMALHSSELGMQRFGLIMGLRSFLQALISGLAYALLIWAAFRSRQSPESV